MKRVERIQWLHSKIVVGKYPNSSELAENFGISVTQAKRDIEYLRKNLGAPLIYNASRRGYSYDVNYPMPKELSQDNFIGTPSHIDTRAAVSAQLQLPYSATLKVSDKLAVLELRPFIINNVGKNLYSCEFRSIELFLSVILSLDADIQIVEPEWIRIRLVESAKRVIRNNAEK